jgi:hypothetical protein
VSEAWRDAPTATFDFKGSDVEVAYLPALWRATVGANTSESRRLDALTAVVGPSAWSPDIARLAVEVMQWRATQKLSDD